MSGKGRSASIKVSKVSPVTCPIFVTSSSLIHRKCWWSRRSRKSSPPPARNLRLPSLHRPQLSGRNLRHPPPQYHNFPSVLAVFGSRTGVDAWRKGLLPFFPGLSHSFILCSSLCCRLAAVSVCPRRTACRAKTINRFSEMSCLQLIFKNCLMNLRRGVWTGDSF